MEFPVGIRVLAVDNNPICLGKLEDMLLLCKYHVTKTTDAKKAMEMLREKINMFDMVITDADTDGFKLLEIGVEMGLPVIMLSQDNSKESVMKAVVHGASDYLVKPVGRSDLENKWLHVVKKNINKYAKRIGLSTSTSTSTSASTSTQEPPPSESHLPPSSIKKPYRRTAWTPELHQMFLTAIEQLGGVQRAFPKQIHDLMNVEGLTREKVASHLQKYRMWIKRVEYLHFQMDEHGNFSATRQVPSLSGSHLTQLNPSVCPSMNLQQGNHQNPINSPEYSNALLPGDLNLNLF